MEEEQQTKQLFKGALLLTMAGLISKVLSAGYRIPLQNITGDAGFYIYQQIYPFLGIALMLSLYGFPAAISKLVAEERKQGKKLSIGSFYLPVFILLIIINVILFLILYLSAGTIAEWMGDARLAASLHAASFTFLVVPFSSAFRGLFQGLNDMKPTAVSQIVEQLVRVSIILASAFILVEQGGNIYEIGTGAGLASLLGISASSLILLIIWVKRKPWHQNKYVISWKYYFETIFLYGFIICLNYMMLLLVQFADAFTLMPNLVEFGVTKQDAIIWKGVFDRGQPLVQLGTVLGSSVALALVPTVTRQRMDKNRDQLKVHVKSAWKFSLFFSSGAAAGLIAILPYANVLLFENSSGTASLQILALTILFASLAMTVASILQGLGYIRVTAVIVLLGLACKWLLNEWLVPIWGISGSAAATVFSVLIILLINVWQLKRLLPELKLMLFNWRSLIFSLAGMLILLGVMDNTLGSTLRVNARTDYAAYTVLACLAGGVVYTALFVRLNGFTNEELRSFPLGELLVRFNKGGS
ncbi:putative polysaccharide biosynthesis protein [Sediminibacillus albus]|uniref:Polysaccharide transporter, PST family n=1 Tax=Sediminibacillus albus TaxID=407036 RepID=A0A1G9D922_9BACI|nr:polysaccharide biosynthesis protein [Sediminibacillus albus]SDK60392.1 polysaccharide transporter, PST family [Sediminibacillus albus]